MEKQQIIERYKKRENEKKGVVYDLKPENQYIYYNYDFELSKLLQNDFLNGSITKKSILIIGSGFGREVYLLNRLGVHPSQISCFEVLEDRCNYLKSTVNGLKMCVNDYFHSGSVKEKFDYVICSTVFSSILDEKNRIQLLKDIENVLELEGKLIIFDFIYNNPKNKDVKKFVTKEYIRFTKLKTIKNKRIILYPAITQKIFQKLPLLVFILTQIRLLNTHSITILKA